MNVEPGFETSDGGDDEFATPSEALDAIRALLPTDHAKLSLIARRFCATRSVGPVMGPDDLLHDAIVATANGEKRWKKEVSIVRHLDRAMENISGHAVKKARRVEYLEDADFEPQAETPSVHSQLIAKEQLEAVLPHLEGDERALEVLRLRSEGFTASEIRDKTGMSEREYDTTSRRIRRLRERYQGEATRTWNERQTT